LCFAKIHAQSWFSPKNARLLFLFSPLAVLHICHLICCVSVTLMSIKCFHQLSALSCFKALVDEEQLQLSCSHLDKAAAILRVQKQSLLFLPALNSQTALSKDDHSQIHRHRKLSFLQAETMDL
jgi:hypothetical protein